MNELELVRLALAEDLPQGDITTDGLGLKIKEGKARLLAKQDLTLSGRSFFETAAHELDPTLNIHWHFNDGAQVLHHQTICTVQGNMIPLLKAERVGLNFLQRFSGIATLTNAFVATATEAARITGKRETQILDTRKTTPLLRQHEKKAVRDGGGKSHRFSLSDAILIKDNHIALAGGIPEAVALIRQHWPTMSIEVEASDLHQVQQAINAAANRILLDNMNDDLLFQSLKLIPHHIETEASGNMSLNRIKKIGGLGLSFISVGSITHSAPAADLSLIFE